jgi:hypothetical protein
MDIESLRYGWVGLTRSNKKRRLRAAFVWYMHWVEARPPAGKVIVSIDEITEFLGISDKTAKRWLEDWGLGVQTLDPSDNLLA